MFYDWDWIGSFINPVYLNENKFITGYQNVTSAARDLLNNKNHYLLLSIMGIRMK